MARELASAPSLLANIQQTFDDMHSTLIGAILRSEDAHGAIRTCSMLLGRSFRLQIVMPWAAARRAATAVLPSDSAWAPRGRADPEAVQLEAGSCSRGSRVWPSPGAST